MITLGQWESADNVLDKKIREWENSNHLIAKMALNTRFLYLSPALGKLLGYPLNAFHKKKGWEFIVKADRKKINFHFKRYKQLIDNLHLLNESNNNQVVFSDPIRIRIKTVHGSLYSIKTVFAIINRTIYSISMDNCSCQAEKAVKKVRHHPGPGRENLRFLLDGLENLGVGINIVGSNHKILFQNRVLDEQFGPPDDTPCYVKYRWEEEACDSCPFLKAIGRNKSQSRIIKTNNGNDYEVMAAPILSPDNTVTRALGLFINITERTKTDEQKRKLEYRLQRAEKLESIGILAGGVAHDLNNILSALVGYPDLLIKELPENNYTRDLIIAIKDSGVKAAAVVQDLLTLSRQGLQHAEVVNLNRIITDYFKSLQFNKVKSHNEAIAFKTSLDNNLHNITGSSIHLMKTLMNLINNAVDAIENSGVIAVSTYNVHIDSMLICYENIKAGTYAVLKVEDTGEGINPDDLERIFEPFYTKKMIDKFGTGLGLAVVWSTVKEHNGYIDVKSAPGKGTAFELFFPITSEAVAHAPGEINMNQYQGKGEKILVVDDMKEQREIASKILSHLGYFIAAVSNGEDAVEYLKKYPMDMVMVDMIMESGMDGLDTYMEILKINPGQKVMIISGYSETERIKKAQTLGAAGYIKKPYTIRTLGIAVKNCLMNIKPETPDG